MKQTKMEEGGVAKHPESIHHGDVSEGSTSDAIDGRALLWKIDRRLLPLLCFTYMLQSIDKTTLGYAAVFNIREDTNLKGTEYSWLGSLFYLGYLVMEYPFSILLQKLPVNKVMAATVIVWGAILMFHAVAKDFAGLATVRTLLGVFECAINPGTMMIFSLWYKRNQQPFRMGIWIGSAGVAYVMAGITSFGLGHINGSLDAWKYNFLFWGAITTAWGVVLWFFLPGSPVTSTFLTQKEKQSAIDRVLTNGTGIESKNWNWDQVTLLDAKTWLLFIFALTSNCPNGGLTTFQGLIIKGLGFSTLRTVLIQMPLGGVQAIVCVGATYFASRYPNCRLAVMLICLIPFLTGILGLWLLDESKAYGRLACLWISFSYTATWTLSMSVAVANTAGATKRTVTNATLIVGYCLGNFAGPFFFIASQAPGYSLGVGMMLFCVVVQVLCIVGIWVLLWQRNRSRRTNASELNDVVYENDDVDATDKQKKAFRYVY
ncbi:major facilitator superfamily transporter [Cadophora sp. DSE1049]|nr:major facilitator superfamily transporter [Cadophora sp. DSE1049]